MSELQSTIETGNLDELRTVISRLRSLPEFGMYERVDDCVRAVDAAQTAQNVADNARQEARRMILRLLKKCRANWTAEEINKATGYED